MRDFARKDYSRNKQQFQQQQQQQPEDNQQTDMMPQAIEAETHLLSMILGRNAMSQVADRITANDFYRDVHRSIYEAMLSLYQRNEIIDFITVGDLLTQKGVTLEGEVGCITYLSQLSRAGVDDFFLESDVAAYADIIVDKALARNGMHACGQAAHAFMHEQASVALAQAEAMFFELSQKRHHTEFTPLSSIADVALQRVIDMQKLGGVLVGIPSKFHDLDRFLNGFQDEKLIIVAGRPGMGKTSWALTVAYNAAKQGSNVGILSLEMSKEELFDRLVAIDGRLDARRISSGQLDSEEMERFTTSTGRLSSYPIYIDDTFGCSLTELRSKARRLHAEHGLDMLIVDYLQLMDADDKETDNEVKMLSIISRGLKGIARQLHIPVLALAQLNREVEKRQVKVPQLSDLRGSGTLEQDADIVLFIYRDEEYNQESERKGQADIIIAKHRGGPKGTVVLKFDESQTRFDNLDLTSEERYGLS
jgi:replicative DNA helicase